MIKNIIKKLIPKRFKNIFIYYRDNYLGGFENKSYSQEGEDRILQRIFEYQPTGFYVDVGAHHPLRFSNTYLFYKRGWRGINIDAMPGSMKAFHKRRPHDTNIEQPIANEETTLTYFSFNEPALNGFSKELSVERNSADNIYHVIEEIPLKTKRLSQILDQYLPAGQQVDFLSIDVEGLDFEVLKSNNWDKYSPKVILIEILSQNVEGILKSSIHVYLTERGYELFGKCVQTAIYRKLNV